MPYWSIYCLWCNGYLADALLECVPAQRRADPGYVLLVLQRAGAALACPYCGGLIGFDDKGQVQVPESGWPVFRYGRAELETKRDADGEPATTSLPDWALRYRFLRPAPICPWGTTLMLSKPPLMRLSPEEDNFLRHWMYDEMHYREGTGPAKRLQRDHQVVAGHLAVLIAAAIPDVAEQWAAGAGPPPAHPPTWPWSNAAFAARVAEAGTILQSVRPPTPVESPAPPAGFAECRD